MNKLVEKFGGENRWVNYKIIIREGKKTKVPYSPITKKMASSTNQSDWSTYDVANKNSKDIGIVFTPDQKLLGIDIDKCLNKNKEIEHSEKENIENLIKEANTYTEISPSGNGLHLFLIVSDGLSLLSHRTASLPYEIYTSGRYFTVTQNIFNEEKDIRTVTIEEANKILSIIGYPWTKQITSPKINIPIVLDDQELIKRMFSSKSGKKIEALYNGDTSNNSGDDSASDLSLCSSLAFWTGRNASQIERIWLSSPLGNREKIQKRQDYRTRTINTAIASCKDIYETPKMKQEKVNNDLDLDLLYIINDKKDKIFIQNTENMCRILRKHPDFQGRLQYDSFKNTLEIKKNGKWQNIEDNDAVHYQTLISILFPCFIKVGKDMVYDAIIKVAKENTVDSASDYICSLRWDGVDRLATWLCSTYGVANDEYHRAVGSNWIKGLIKRIVEPGCKFDYVLVLEGEQGSKKSTSLYILGKSWHVETAMSTDSKDFFMQFAGKAIVEFSEGETLSRTEVKRMKAIITMQTDKYRPPYERSSQEFPRRCVFAMTTNQTEYLKDETGNRRWLPITCVFPEANIDWLETNREQLFAEAYHRVFNLKETIYEFPKEATLAAQQQREIKDANTDLIVDWYYNTLSKYDRDDGITIHQVYKQALNGGFASKPLDKYNEMLIAGVIRKSLKLIKRRSMKDGVQCNRWYNETATQEELIPSNW